ncbi:MAG: T9SS type A sorting domain-containing protein [Bacteroidota bacterium]
MDEIITSECNFTISECTTSSTSTNFEFPIKRYPNPANDFLNIENHSDFEIDRLILYNSMGQRGLQENTRTGSLRLGALSAGFYILEVIGDGHRQLHKLMIQR